MQFERLCRTITEQHQLICESRRDMYSWLTPEGTFIPVESGSDHGIEAHMIILKNKKLQIRLGKDLGSVRNGDKINYLMNNKFQRITYYGDDLYSHNPKFPPTNKQLFALKNIAIENQMRFIRWDNEDDDKILWNNLDY